MAILWYGMAIYGNTPLVSAIVVKKGLHSFSVREFKKTSKINARCEEIVYDNIEEEIQVQYVR